MFEQHWQRYLIELEEEPEDEESIDDDESLPDLLDDPLETGQELNNNPVEQAGIQRERLAIEEVLLEEMGYEFEDEEPLDPEILEAYQNRVNNSENPVGFFQGFIAALDNMDN